VLTNCRSVVAAEENARCGRTSEGLGELLEERLAQRKDVILKALHQLGMKDAFDALHRSR
jgi:hypothetical protein